MKDWVVQNFAPGPIFAWVAALTLLIVPLIWIRSASSQRRPRLRFSSTRLFEGISTSWVYKTWFLPPLLRTAAIFALIIALARPQSGGEYRDTSEGIAIQMVMDRSGSMAADDFEIAGRRVRRIDAVKKVFEDFVLGKGKLKGREGDLVGLTTFAMFADTPCPLTLDHGNLADLARKTEIPGWVDGRQVRQHEESGHTALGDAIALAADDLRRAGEQAVNEVAAAQPAKSRVMILLTDGADNPPRIEGMTPIAPLEAAQVAATLGIRIYTIGAAGDMPARSRGFFTLSRTGFDPGAEAALKEIANITGGKYFRATDTESLVAIYDEIDRLERRRTGERTYYDNIALARLSMLIGLGCLLAELTLTSGRYQRVP